MAWRRRVATYLRGGLGSSRRAVEAEERGLMPFTRALKEAKRLYPEMKLSREQREALKGLASTGEWHHTGKYASKTEFYDPRRIVAIVKRQGRKTRRSRWVGELPKYPEKELYASNIAQRWLARARVVRETRKMIEQLTSGKWLSSADVSPLDIPTILRGTDESARSVLRQLRQRGYRLEMSKGVGWPSFLQYRFVKRS